MPKKKKNSTKDTRPYRKKGVRKGAARKGSPAPLDQPSPSGERREGHLFVVGMGASAGGLEAFELFFSHTPADCGMAFVLIQHISPNYNSVMVDILKKHTGMKVFQVEDGMQAEPNCVYVKPPDRDVVISNGTLRLIDLPALPGLKHPIDVFFQSLAKDQAENAICVILSGTGTDGVIGLKAIKDTGGISVVQDEKSAKYSGMPASAIATGLPDFILPVEKMPEKLVEYVKYKHSIQTRNETIPAARNSRHLGKVFALLQAKTGHNFTHYKQATVNRRIEKRMAVNRIDNLADYVVYLQQHPAEVDALFKELLIRVTRFFRDKKLYEFLKEKAVPLLFESNSHVLSVRIWVVGCATGEEAYSIAMVLKEYLDTISSYAKIQIFATDIDDDALNFARAATYQESIAADVSPERLRRFFAKKDNVYTINKEIREMVFFANHNLIKDPPFSRLDVISCRNLLIYLEPVLQKRLLPLFHYALKPGRFLILGSAENIGEFTHLFSVVDKAGNVFRRNGFSADQADNRDARPLTAGTAKPPFARETEKSKDTSMGEIVKKTMLENYTPPCVVINGKYDVVYFQGQTDAFLKTPGGDATLNIMKMAMDDLRLELRTAIQKAAQEKTTFIYKNVQVKIKDAVRTINVIVSPFSEKPPGELMLVVFDDVTDALPQSDDSLVKKGQSSPLSNRVLTLERELEFTKESLRETIEELEASNEKFKTSNEMVQAINEELQSANEELETSKEELQSMNEELVTVNSELQIKIEELSQSNDDITNLLSSTEIGTIFLDKRLRIKRFTPATTGVISLIEADIGRPIQNISTNILDKDLVDDINEVVKTLIPKEKIVRVPGNMWYLVRIFPYRTVTNIVDGATITLIDITKHKRAEEEIHLLQTLTLAISESEDIHSALKVTLRKVCEATGWVYGEIWMPASAAGARLELTDVWHARHDRMERFVHASREFTFQKDAGFPGRVWAAKRPEWIKDVTLDEHFMRRQIATEAGFKAGLAIPILSAKEVVAVMVFFVFEVCDEDERLIKLISSVASQLGLVIQRKRAEEMLKKAYDESESLVEERTRELLWINKHLRDEVAERKGVEAQLLKLSYVVEQSPNTVIITDTNGNIEYVNPTFTQLTGYLPDEVIGQNPRILKSGKTPPEEYKRLWDTITSGREWTGEFYNRRKNGGYYWESASISPLKNQGGAITHFVAIKEDITVRKLLEDEVKAAARFPAENPYPVLRIAQDGTILYANPASASLLREWNCEVYQCVPDFLKQSVEDALKTKLVKKNVKVGCGNKTVSFTIVPVVDTNYVNLYGIDEL